MVMVIVTLLLGKDHRAQGWPAVKANSTKMKTIPLVSGLSAWQIFAISNSI
jgi:hypothetical protein